MSGQEPTAQDLGGRVYPSCCTSDRCGKGPASCPGCTNYPTQKDFTDWRERTVATRPDPQGPPAGNEEQDHG